MVEKPFRLTVIPASDGDVTTMGYAIPRSMGNAVARNRLRRQMRQVMSDLDSQGELPRGSVLVSVSPHASMGFGELSERMASLCRSAVRSS